MALRRTALRLTTLLILAALVTLPGSAQGQTKESFLAEHYDVSATLDPGGQSLSATAKVDFVARDASSIVHVELHPNLNVGEIRNSEGKAVNFERDGGRGMGITISLPAQIPAGGKVTLTFTYSGVLANEENSPSPGVRLASITRDSAYLLLPARWFPLTDYPSHAYTGVFRLNVPDTFAVAGTGKAATPAPVAGQSSASGSRLVYEFHCDRPGLNGSFVAGPLQFNPHQAEGINVAVYAPRADSGKAADFANVVAKAITTFSDLFGPIPDPSMTLIQIPDNTVRDFAGPGLLLLPKRYWDPKFSEHMIARMVASQWWGNQVLPASPADVWLSDGLSRYSESLYAEQSAGKEAGLRVVDEFAVGALMYEDAAPIAQEARLQPFTGDYRSVVVNKGAMVFHMLRGQMGDGPFKQLLHDFYFRFAEKTASIADLQALAEAESQAAASKTSQAAPNLRAFFAQWLNSTGVPDFSLEYVVYRTPKGFRIVGKIKQPLDTFSMPVELRIDTEGNPELKTVDVTGTESTFEVETFGRPKPGGIKIDPNNIILKGSPSLRARAAIARGEELAEVGRYYDAIQQYQRALNIQPGRPLANFRMGEAFFYQKNYQAAANAFREALNAVPEPSEKWTEVWGHIYLGKIFDLLGQRARAVNEYSKAKQTNDNTGGAQDAVDALIKKPYGEGTQAADPAKSAPATPAAAPADDRPKLKKPAQ